VTFLSGKIHELNIHVPWTQLYSEPAVITINTIECVLKLKETNFPAEGLDEATEIQQADIKATSAATAPQTESEKALPPGYVQSLLNKVIYNLTVKVNNFVLKYIEDDIVLSLNVKSAEFHSANENWVKAFVDVAAPDWVLHKMCNISDLTVCLDRRNASGIIEIYQDPLAYRCNLSCRMQVHYDKDGFHLPLEKNLSVYCECLEVSITDQQLPLLLRLLKLGLSVYYGTLDLPGCEPPTHSAKDIVEKKGQNSSQNIMSTLPATFGVETDTELSETGWLSWAYSMVPGLSGDQRTSDALLAPLVSRFGVYISQATLSFKVTEPMSEGNFLGAQRFEFKPILTLEASGVAQEMVTKGSSFFDFQMGVTSVTGWLVDECVCKNQERGRSDEGDGTTREPEVG
jgi:vacuolar protein sorting-associated protein 13B